MSDKVIVEAERHKPGNAAAMRDALLKVKKLFDGRIMWQNDICEAHKAVNAVLAEPPRNCDVGTAEEQVRRFLEYCDSKVCNRRDCACGYEELFRHKCAIRWSQMPYEEGGHRMIIRDAMRVLSVCHAALVAGAEMRQAQKAYLGSRSFDKLQAAKDAEKKFDAALADALWAIAHGEPKPTQEAFL